MAAVIKTPRIVVAPLIATFREPIGSSGSLHVEYQPDSLHSCDVCNDIEFYDLDPDALGAIGLDIQHGVTELTFVVEYISDLNQDVKDECELRAFLRQHSVENLNFYRSGPLSRPKIVQKLWAAFEGSGRLRERSLKNKPVQCEVAHVIICTNGMDGILKPQSVPQQFEANRARLWLDHCKLEHGPTCNEEVTSIEGMRLIDCERLLMVDTEPSRTYEWLALSYVWGGPDLSAFPDTPRTITDAIAVTKQLGYRYLWVDQYCIDQGNEASKKDQLSKMDQIYRGAVLTIVAVMGTSKHYGLPGIGPKRTCREAKFVVNRSRRVLFFSDSDPDIDIRTESPWYQRAWTYQEGYLSRRLLVFTDEQAAFFCKCDSWMESWGGIEHLQRSSQGNCVLRKTPCALFQQQLRLPRTMSSETCISDQLYEFLNLASQYTCRALSFDSDALNAFSGVMQHLRRVGQEPRIYDICGLPFLPSIESEDDQLCYIFITLAWSSSIREPRRRSQFPSWSWAGWTGGVSWAWDSSPLASLKTMMRNAMFGLPDGGMMQAYRKIRLEQLSSVTKLGFQAPVIPASNFSVAESWRLGKDPLRHLRLWGNPARSDTNHRGFLETTAKSFLEQLETRTLTCFLLGSFHDRLYILVVQWQGDDFAVRIGDFYVFIKEMEDDLASYEWRSIILV